jgi:ferredoxin
MSDITINNETCSGCGICTKICPYLILELNADLKKATVNEHAAPYCSHCGHCSAICPEGAITITYPGAAPIPLVADSIPTAGELSRLITTRRSIRDYKDKKVPKETLEQIFDVIRYAPTGMNGQSVHWLVIQEPEEVWKFAGKIIDWAVEVLKTQPDHILAPILPMIIQAYEQGSDKVCHGAPPFGVCSWP